MKLLRYILGWLCFYPRNTRKPDPLIGDPFFRSYLQSVNSPKIHR